jgi:hypothetical protein
MEANVRSATCYRTEIQNIRRKEQWQIDALAMMVAVAVGVNLRDVTTVGVLDQQEGEDLWSGRRPRSLLLQPVANRRPWRVEAVAVRVSATVDAVDCAGL